MRISSRPILVYPPGPSPLPIIVRNDGPDAVKYAATEAGAASGTSLASGSSVSLTSPMWFVTVAGASSNVTVSQPLGIDSFVVLTQAEYTALATPDSSTLYILVG